MTSTRAGNRSTSSRFVHLAPPWRHASYAECKCIEIVRVTKILVVHEKAEHRLPVRRLII